MKAHHHEEFVKYDECPLCHHKIELAKSVEGNCRPVEGDLTLCFYCTAALKYDDRMNLEVLSLEEFATLDFENQAQLLAAKNQIVEWHKQGRKSPPTEDLQLPAP